MSKHKQLAAGLANRTKEPEPDAVADSLYDDGSKGKFSLGPDFVEGLEPPLNVELVAENERLEEELSETSQRLAEAEQAVDKARQEIAAIEEHAIVPTNDASLKFRGLKMKAIGIDKESIPDNMSEADLIGIIHTLRQVNEAMQWTVGDLINHACSKWGEKYSYYAKETGYTEKTLREYAYVARSVNLSIRMDRLSFGHHQLVAGFKDAEGKPLSDTQQDWLSIAAAGDNPDDNQVWSVARLRQAIIAAKKADRASSATNVDSTLKGKQMRNLAKLLDTDVSELSEEKRAEYISHINSLRTLLNTIEGKLEKRKKREKTSV